MVSIPALVSESVNDSYQLNELCAEAKIEKSVRTNVTATLGQNNRLIFKRVRMRTCDLDPAQLFSVCQECFELFQGEAAQVLLRGKACFSGGQDAITDIVVTVYRVGVGVDGD